MAKNANGILPQTDESQKHKIIVDDMKGLGIASKDTLRYIKEYGETGVREVFQKVSRGSRYC